MINKPRTRRPYEQKRASKAGALIFGVGLAALAITVLTIMSLGMPYLSSKLDSLSFRVQTYYRKLVPHPEYLPTPAPVVVTFTRTPEIIPSPSPPSPPTNEAPATTTPQMAAAVASPTTAPTGTATAVPPIKERPPLPPQAQLAGFSHQWQTWNNCGPATITTYMSYFNHLETQVEAAEFLKPNRNDKNVSPHELAAYAQSAGMPAIVRQGGSLEQLKTFIHNGFPVLVETWLVHDGDGLGHYRLITGYDDVTAQLTTSDSLSGPDYQVSYAQFDADWRVFNRLYLIVYPQEQAQTVTDIIGADMNETVVYERLLAEAQVEIAADPTDAIAFFNQGEALTRLDRPAEAVVAFDQARTIGLHWRRLWYQFAPFEAYYQVGRYQDVLDLAEATLAGTGGLEEAFYYQGLTLQTTGQPGATDSFAAALEYNPNFQPASQALEQLQSAQP